MLRPTDFRINTKIVKVLNRQTRTVDIECTIYGAGL